MTKALEDFAAAVANDFIEPDVAIDIDEERAFGDADGLGVLGNDRVHEVVPDFQDFEFGLLAFKSESLENAGDEVADRFGAASERLLGLSEIDAAKLGQDGLFRRELDARGERRHRIGWALWSAQAGTAAPSASFSSD